MGHGVAARSPRALVGHNNKRRGWDGAGAKILQVEHDILDHHEVMHRPIRRWRLEPQPDADSLERTVDAVKHVIHATAVASIIHARNIGVAPQVDYQFTSLRRLPNMGDNRAGLVAALTDVFNDEKDNFRPGDILSISTQMQFGDQSLPVDADEAIQSMINQLTTKRRLLVFIAAANGSLNLDDEKKVRVSHASYKEVSKHSTAIKVGYTNFRANSYLQSNYGSAVEFAFRAESVMAACYVMPGRPSDVLDADCGGFRRTSASTPMLASIAACIQGELIAKKRRPLDRDEMVSFLREHSPRFDIDGLEVSMPLVSKLAKPLKVLIRERSEVTSAADGRAVA